jgi:hypothetical protein
MMTKICAWCGIVIEKDKTVIPGGERLVTHGLCAVCEALTGAERDKIADAKEKERKEKAKGESENENPT